MPCAFLFGSARDAPPPPLNRHRRGELQARGRRVEKSGTACAGATPTVPA